MSTRDNCFGVLRFVFALIIVIAHLRVLTQIPDLECTRWLSLVVNRTAFFVISGFLIMVSYDHKVSDTERSVHTTGGVRDEQRLYADDFHHPDRQSDSVHVVALVVVETTLHGYDGLTA